MPPKSAPVSLDLTEKNVKIIAATLCSLDGFKPDWNFVYQKFGLGKGGHGPRDFKAAIAKLGLEIKDGKFVMIGGDDATTAPANGTTATATAGAGAKKSAVNGKAGTAKKRKAAGKNGEGSSEESIKGEESDEDEKPKKKVKAAKVEDDDS